MLEVMRRNARSFVIQIVFAVIVVVFIFWGVGSQGDRPTPVAKVNGTSILDGEFNNAFQDRIRFAQRYDQEMTDERIAGLKTEVLDDLIVRELILQTAEDEGLVVSDHELALSIMAMRHFQDEEGRFDQELYETNLRQLRKSETMFEEEQREGLLIQRMEGMIRRAVHVSEAELLDQYNKDNHKLNLEFVRISSALFRAEVDASEERVAQYATDHETECRAYFDENYERLYHTPKRVQASQIMMLIDPEDPQELRDEVKRRMEGVLEEVKAGDMSFTDLAAKYSDHHSARFGGDLGFFDENRQGSPYGEEAFKAAAFSLGEGELSELITTSEGLHILQIEKIEDESTKEFDEVKLEIAERLLVDDEAPELARQFAEELAAPFSQNGDTQEKMDSMNLRSQETGLFAVGEPSIPRIGAAPEILSAAMEQEPIGQGPPTAFSVFDNWIVFRVIAEELPNPAGYEDAREELAATQLRRKRYDRVDAWKDSLKADAEIAIYDVSL